jgi:hypothetical protein
MNQTMRGHGRDLAAWKITRRVQYSHENSALTKPVCSINPAFSQDKRW